MERSKARAAAQYVRMSTEMQPLSIGAQKAAIAAYAREHGFEIVRTYCDDAKSGVTIAGRAAMKRLLSDVMQSSCPFKTVLVLDVSRWGRFQDADEGAYYEYHCRRNGVSVQYVGEPFGTELTPLNSIVKQLKRAMAAEYSRELAIKVRAGHVRAVEAGFAVGSLPCVGYRRMAVSVNGKRKGIIPHGERKPSITDRTVWVLGPKQEQEIVKRVFREFAAGARLGGIARALNNEGMKTHDGERFTGWKLRHLIDNEIVRGNFIWGARRARVSHPRTNLLPFPDVLRVEGMVRPLISAKLWDAAQQRLAQNTHYYKQGYPKEWMLRRLREELEKNPSLGYYDLSAAHLPQAITYAKHFGSLANAYALAGRPRSAAQLGFGDTYRSAQALRQQLVSDLVRLLSEANYSVECRAIENVLVVNGTMVKVFAARKIEQRFTDAWQIKIPGRRDFPRRWVLILRLNADHETGIDFYLLPPAVAVRFRGWLRSDRLIDWQPYRAVDSSSLLRLFRKALSAPL